MNAAFATFEQTSRKKTHAAIFQLIQDKIDDLFEPEFITAPDESSFIEAAARLTSAKQILEVGMYTGHTTLHLIRAVYPDGKVTAVDHSAAHDTEFFARPEIAKCFTFVRGSTPEVLRSLTGNFYDMVFIDSDHSLEHTEKEFREIQNLTRPGAVFLFHDCYPSSPLHPWLLSLVGRNILKGLILPTPTTLRLLLRLGPGYNPEFNPHLGLFIRT